MVKVTFKPWQEIVIHEAVEYKLEDLIKNRTLDFPKPQPLLWAEGIIFNRIVMPSTEDVIRDQLQGIIHYSAVEWAIMPKFENMLKSDGTTISIIDVSNNPNLRDVAKGLKQKVARKE